VTARTAADLVGINRRTAILFYHKVRQVIAAHLALQAEEMLGGEIELDESCFGGARKGKRGRGAAGKVVVSGILKRGGRVYTDCYRSYNALDVSGFQPSHQPLDPLCRAKTQPHQRDREFLESGKTRAQKIQRHPQA
jgi:transposase-like protein